MLLSNVAIVYRWVHEQHLVHEAQGSSATKGKSSFLPSMETHVLAGHQPRLMVSPQLTTDLLDIVSEMM